MTPLLRRLLPPALLAATAVVGTAPAVPADAAPTAALPAAPPADSCPELDLDDEAAVVGRAEKVDDVFVGRVDDVVRRPVAGGESKTEQASKSPKVPSGPRGRVVGHKVTVTTVLSGDLRLGQKVTIYFERSEDGRNRLLGTRETHLFFTRDVSGELRADYCEGSKELPDGLSASLQRTLEGYLSGAPAPPARVVLHTPQGGADEPPRLSRVIAPGAAISLIGVLGLFLVARVGRRRG